MIVSMHRCVLLALAALTLTAAACASGVPHKGDLPLPPPDAPASQPVQR